MEQNELLRNHKLSLNNRKNLVLTGIKDVEAFDGNQVILESVMGKITVIGTDLKVNRLNLDKGEVDVEGHVDSITYSDAKAHAKKSTSVLKRMFQ